jgi:glucokinase
VTGRAVAACAIGIDIGGTHLRAARVEPGGGLGPVLRAPSAGDPETVVERALGLVRELGLERVAAVGVGVPGQVAADGRMLWGGFVNLAGVDLAGRLGAATGLPVAVENDGTMALIAEAACGAARGLREAALMTIGTGIGGAVLRGGRVLRGRATAGQLGHMTVDAGGLPCLCGRRGCVETTSSGTALGRLVAAAGLPPGTGVDALLARREADPAAARLLADWAGPLRAAIETLAAVSAPEAVLLGGGLGRAAAAALAGLPPKPSWFPVAVRPAALGDDAGVIGAGLAALGALRPAAAVKRAVLVNGVPASGKSAVARALADATGWPVLALDAVKDPFLAELGPVDRAANRRLGRASYAALFALLRAAPAGTTAIVDAWFGFQPADVLEAHLAAAGVAETAELWCHAPPETIGARYAARVGARPAGHPGLDYVPELIALAGRARPLGRGPALEVDTTAPPDAGRLRAWLGALWPDLAPAALRA